MLLVRIDNIYLYYCNTVLLAVLCSDKVILNASNEQLQHYCETTTSTVRFLLLFFCPHFFTLFFSLFSLFFRCTVLLP